MSNDVSLDINQESNPVQTVAPPKEDNNMLRATDKITALYCRLSVEDTKEKDGKDDPSNSIQHQKKLLEDYAKSHGFTNCVHFTDDGWSGANFDRPNWKRMIESIESGEVSHVLVKDLSRVGRDYLQVGFYTEVMFRENGVRFIAIANGVDSDKRESSEFAPFLNIMNEWYVRDSSRKITTVLRAKGMSGAHLTNHCIYGYKKDPNDKNHWIIDEEAAEVVRRIYRMAIEGKGPYETARILALEKIERPSYYLAQRGMGNHKSNYNSTEPYAWRGNTISDILSKPEYMGEKTDMNRANEVRPMFRRLADVAERTGCAVILIGHLNKAAGGQSAYRGLGSIDFRAAARSVLLIGRVKREPNVRVIVHDKSSLAPEGKPVAFCLDPETGFSWIGEYDITADELLSGAGGNTATKTEQAERLILDLLADGKELASEDIVKAAAEAGISERTVQNAKRNMGGILGARRVGGQWYNFIKKKQPPEPAS